MPLISKAVTELNIHIFDPIIRQAAHRILQSLSYTDVIGDQIYINTDWSTHSKTSDAENNANLGRQAFNIDVNLQMNPTSQKFDVYTFHHTAAYQVGTRLLNESSPVYFDKENYTRMIELRSPVTIVLNCELILTSAELAFQTPQQIFNDHENGAVYSLTDFVYDYPVDKTMLAVIHKLWSMDRNKGKLAGIKFQEYVRQNTNDYWQLHKHRDKEQYEYVIPVRDLEVITTLEYNEDRPSGIMEDKLPVGFQIPFIYTLQFEMPTVNILQYPAIYDNQLVPGNYIPQDKNIRHNKLTGNYMKNAYENYVKQYDKSVPGYVQTPVYDEWVVPVVNQKLINGYYTVMILGLLVNEEDENLETVVDISGEIDPTFELSNLVKEILYQQGAESVEYDPVYRVSLYRDDKPMLPNVEYTFNEDLQLIFKAPDKTARYRFVLSAARSLEKINPKWHPLLKKYYAFLNPLIKSQIKQEVEFGPWKDPSLPKDIYLDDKGTIRDDRGNELMTLEETKFPYNTGNNSYKHKGVYDGYSESNRIHRFDIVAHKSGEPSSGITRQTSGTRRASYLR